MSNPLSLTTLPLELQEHILSYLPLKTLLPIYPLTSHSNAIIIDNLSEVFYMEYVQSRSVYARYYEEVKRVEKLEKYLSWKRLAVSLCWDEGDGFGREWVAMEESLGESLMLFDVPGLKKARVCKETERFMYRKPVGNVLQMGCLLIQKGMEGDGLKKILWEVFQVMRDCFEVLQLSGLYEMLSNQERYALCFDVRNIEVFPDLSVSVASVFGKHDLSYFDYTRREFMLSTGSSFDVYTGTEESWGDDFIGLHAPLGLNIQVSDSDDPREFLDTHDANVVPMEGSLSGQISTGFLFNALHREALSSCLDSFIDQLRLVLEIMKQTDSTSGWLNMVEYPLDDPTTEIPEFNILPSVVPGFTMHPNFTDIRTITTQHLDWIFQANYSMAIYGYDFINQKQSSNVLSPQLEILKQKVSDFLGIDFTETLIIQYSTQSRMSPHKDKSIFGPVIACVTLTGEGVLEFETADLSDKASFYIPAGSLYVMENEARTTYAHGMNLFTPRQSISFRTLSEDFQQ